MNVDNFYKAEKVVEEIKAVEIVLNKWVNSTNLHAKGTFGSHTETLKAPTANLTNDYRESVIKKYKEILQDLRQQLAEI